MQLATGPRVHAAAGTEDEPWPPRFTKFEVELDDGGRLAMTCSRRLGRIRLLDDPESEPPVSRLGFDPLTQMPSARVFLELARRRRGMVKGVLLDQRFAAGVGNWIADEVLFQAGVAPRRRAESLTDEELARLRSRLGAVVRKACSVDADKDRFPRTWLFHRRWGKQAGRTIGGDEVVFDEVAGRTTAWVPARQV